MIQIPIDLEVLENNDALDLDVDCNTVNSCSYKHVYHQETSYDFTQLAVGNNAYCGIRDLPKECYTSDKIVYIKMRDKSGKKPGFWFGCDIFAINENPANGQTLNLNNKLLIKSYYVDDTSKIKVLSDYMGYHTNMFSLSSDQEKVHIYVFAKRNNDFRLRNSKYSIDVYLLDWPDDISPFIDNE